MPLDVQVRVAFPHDEDPGYASLPGSLRISGQELTIWLPGSHTKAVPWTRRRFRPFRGPWPIQFLLTPLFAPTILMGRQDVSWIGPEGEVSCLRIAPFVPPEFWMEVHLASDEDREAVAMAIGALWGPGDGSELKPAPVWFFARGWWRLAGIAVFLRAMIATPLDGPSAGTVLPWWVGVAVSILSMMAIMRVVALEGGGDRCPAGHGAGEPSPGNHR